MIIGGVKNYSFLLLGLLFASTSGFSQDLPAGFVIPDGYLKASEYPNSKVLLPPPPKQGQTASQNDLMISKNALLFQNTPRWRQAALDSNIIFPSAANTFSCAANIDISQKNTPTLYKLLLTSTVDLGLSVYTAKNQYQRSRPFMENGQEICQISAEDQKKLGITYQEGKDELEEDGSYPSGHSSIGWGWALILSEIIPNRTDHILLRGRTFAESRLVCNVHWQSDVSQGKLMGAATVARLHANQNFLNDVANAKKEVIEAQRKKLTPDPALCQAEHEALKLTISGVQ